MIDQALPWSSLIRWASYGAIALALVGMAMLAAMALDDGMIGGRDGLRTTTVVLSSASSEYAPISSPPRLEGTSSARPLGVETEIAVPVWVGASPYVSFVLRLAGAALALHFLAKAFGRADPFAPLSRSSARNVELAAYMLLTVEGVRLILGAIAEAWLRGTVSAPGWRVSVAVERDFYPMVAALVLLAVARAFRQAIAFREDSALAI